MAPARAAAKETMALLAREDSGVSEKRAPGPSFITNPSGALGGVENGGSNQF